MHLLDLFFPRRCVACNKFGKYICVSCRLKIRFIDYQFCPFCRYPSLNGLTHMRCRNKTFLDGIYVGARYWGPVKKSLHLIKYRFVSDLVNELAELLFGRLPRFLKGFDILVPVPLHPKRQKERGFNQAFLISEILSLKMGIPVNGSILKRIRNTRPQFGLKVAERAVNVRNVFEVINSDLIRNKNICLVDDVATTFSTLNQCARILKKTGAGQVVAIVLAHGN